MGIIVGSARIGENSKATGGVKGDSKQKSTPDYVGEVSMQDFYVHKLGWIILRPKTVDVANKLAKGMEIACNNANIGYNQNDRLGVVNKGINTKTKVNADCSSLVRACCKYAGFDTGNFTTANEASVLVGSGKFTRIVFVSLEKTPIYDGDVLVTKSAGHTVIVVSGNPRGYVLNGVDYKSVFDSNYYATKWVDVRNAFGADGGLLFKHFCEFGMKEGRQAIATFNVQTYKANYKDLQKEFGNDLPKYYKHYCEFGKAEGRKGI